jgi:hypothetical protein
MKWAWDKKQAVEKVQQQRVQRHVKQTEHQLQAKSQTASGIAASQRQKPHRNRIVSQWNRCIKQTEQPAKSHRQAAEQVARW